MRVTRSLRLQADLETPAVRQFFDISIQIVDINNNFAGGEGFNPGVESRFSGRLGKVIAENIDRLHHVFQFHRTPG